MGPASLPPGAEIAVLHGNPTEERLTVIRLKFPAGYNIPPHWHPNDEVVTVVSGELSLGMGNRFEEGALQSLPAGSHFTMPAGHRHYVRAKGETVVQIATNVPFRITYVNPQDDPRNR
jgi:quercetin dioxygenase-like cupin family protein